MQGSVQVTVWLLRGFKNKSRVISNLFKFLFVTACSSEADCQQERGRELELSCCLCRICLGLSNIASV